MRECLEFILIYASLAHSSFLSMILPHLSLSLPLSVRVSLQLPLASFCAPSCDILNQSNDIINLCWFRKDQDEEGEQLMIERGEREQERGDHNER